MSGVLNGCDGLDAESVENDTYQLNDRISDESSNDVGSVKVQISLDITKALRKLSNINSMRIAKALYAKSPRTFSELQSETRLEPNILSRTIYEMRANSLLTQKDKQYYLTKYSVVLLDAVNRMRIDLKSKSDRGENLFSAENIPGEHC